MQTLVGQAKAVAVELVKAKIIALWLHIWLKRIAKKYPDFFVKMLDDLLLTENQIKIMKYRYINGLKFKQITNYVFMEERSIHRLHKQVIDKIIKL